MFGFLCKLRNSNTLGYDCNLVSEIFFVRAGQAERQPAAREYGPSVAPHQRD